MIETIENLWFGFYKPLLLGYKNDENVINENSSVPNSVFEVNISDVFQIELRTELKFFKGSR